AETLYKSAAEAQKITYDYELANLYYYQRNYEKMTLKYLDLLHENPNYLNVVENRYQYIMTSSEDENYLEYLEINLLKRIQKYSQKTVYLELITWLFIQTGRYEEAFTQLISLDKKSNTHGNLLIDFGIMLNENSEYDLALNSFDYVINLGENKPNYHYAQIQYLNTLYKKTISSSNHKQEELLKLEQMLEDHLKKSSTKNSFLLTYALANIKAFYLNKMEDASDFLNSVIQEGKLTNNELSECKLLYGDILLFIDNPWDASLIYAQVEKANTNNPFGHEAKFRKAKLAYYTGQFEWAQAQLNILKASTSQLIANDAFELSFFINENSALDTSYNALSMFARSDLLQFKHKHKEALQTLDSIIEQYSSHEIIDDVYYRKGDIYASLEEYDLAIEAYKKVANTYSYDILADNALYKLALLYDHVIKDKPKAMETYKRLLTDYPSSIFVVETRKRFRFLRGETFQEERNIEEDFFRNIYR
ncbi:MAG: tetratricopeptide repeat protein, partial [Bacteroidales bacterium]|nr:tetratricopeptide repeat protein [Bacteroidales bacterium]